MIEQINIALEQKRSRFLSWVVKPAVGDSVEKEHIHQLKVMKNELSRVLHRTGRYCKFTNYEALQ